jgi:predicted transcriptional regulator
VGSNASQLKLLATIREEDMRRRAIEALLADKEMSADDALIAAGLSGETGRKPTDEEKKVNAICGNLGRLTAPQQKRYVSDIAAQLKSDEVKRQLRDLLNQALGDVPDAPTLTPAVSPRMSVKPDYIVCLEDGTRHLNLTARLNKLGMTPGEYRHRWSLPPDYPMVAPNHAMARRAAWKAKLAAIKKAAA